LEKAKQTTLRFVYYLQHELGYKHLGLAENESPVEGLKMNPESLVAMFFFSCMLEIEQRI
jgi:hypothetical protein